MNPALSAILAGIVRQILIALSGMAVFNGLKTDDGTVEWVTGVVVGLATMAYSALRKWWLHTELADAKEALK